MSIEEITAEETGKIAGILEQKWSDMFSRNNRLTAENQSLNLSLDLMTQDRNHWRDEAEQLRRDRDDERDKNEFMLRQWQGVYAIAEETKARVISDRSNQNVAPFIKPGTVLSSTDTPPKAVTFNRQPA